MDFSIVLYVGDTPVVPEDIRVVIPPEFDKYSSALVTEVQKLTQITSPKEEELVKGGLGRVVDVLSRIEAQRKAAAGPVDATKNAIQDAAAGASGPLEIEKNRLENLLIARVASEQARRDSIIREAYAEKERLIREQKQKVLQLQEERQKLMIDARSNEDLIEAVRLRQEARKIDEEIGEAEWQQELREETVVIEPKFSAPLIKGASSPEKIDKKIVDLELLFRAISADILSEKPIGLSKIVTVELKSMAVNELIKDMRQANKGNPDFDVEKNILNIGIEVKIYRKPHIRKSARIVRQ